MNLQPQEGLVSLRVMYLYVPSLKRLQVKTKDVEGKNKLKRIIETILKFREDKKSRHAAVLKQCRLLLDRAQVSSETKEISATIQRFVSQIEQADSSSGNNSKIGPLNSLKTSEIVQNLGYVSIKSGKGQVVVYKCFSHSCEFAAESSSSFNDHLHERHLDVAWNHYCGACSSVISDGSNDSILDELRHLQEVHVEAGGARSKVLGPSQVRPWLKVDEKKKDLKILPALINENCLVATFKCMERSCNFFTSNEVLFARHLELHGKVETGRGLNDCSYCEEVFEDPKTLIKHIKTVHVHDGYQCSYCFYRSIDKFNVLTHIEAHHPCKAFVLFELIPRQSFKESELMKTTKSVKNVAEKVPPMVCVALKCNKIFYTMTGFKEHLGTHKDLAKKHSCNVCEKVLNIHKLMVHYEKCYKIGTYQCLYCRLSTSNEQLMAVHIADSHPTKFMYYCLRSEDSKESSKLGKSVKVQKIEDKNQEFILVNKRIDAAAVINEENVGSLICEVAEDD